MNNNEATTCNHDNIELLELHAESTRGAILMPPEI